MVKRGGTAAWQSPEEVLQERLHEGIYAAVARAAKPIAKLETNWNEAELVKRIVKYLYKAAAEPEMLDLPWRELCHMLIEYGMHGYAASCSETEWFYEIDLKPAFLYAAWEIMTATGQALEVDEIALQELVKDEYEAKLELTLLDRAMWEVCQEACTDDKAKAKLFQVVSKTYWPAFDEVADSHAFRTSKSRRGGGPNEARDLQFVQDFTQRWIEDAMGRVWSSIDRSIMNEESFVRLFQSLVAPFGLENDFSCMPGVLLESIGRPPPDWDFITQTVRDLVHQWEEADAAFERGEAPARPPAKKQRSCGAGPGARLPGSRAPPPGSRGIFEAFSSLSHGLRALVPEARGGWTIPVVPVKREAKEEPPEELDAANEDGGADEEAAIGHPKCTSADKCIGSPDLPTVQHLLNGTPADRYCKRCWESFRERHPGLEGVWDNE